MKIITGARGTSQAGWLSLERGQLDIRDQAQWSGLFAPDSLDAVLSEHVLEHLTDDEARATARNVYAFLRPGGYWRIAVPDANNPDPVYQEMCRPGGSERRKYDFWLTVIYGPDEPGHRAHYNLSSLSVLLNSIGFAVIPLECYDDGGQFWRRQWREADGWIKRSSVSGYLLLDYLWSNCWNTSLIVDAIKPVSSLEYRQVCRWDPEVSLR